MAKTRIDRRRLLQSTVGASCATMLAAHTASAAPASIGSLAAAQDTTTIQTMVWGRPDTAVWLSEAYTRVKPDAAAGVTVEPIVGGSNDPEVAEQFRLMLSAGGQDVPDIIRFNRFSIPEFASAGVLADLTQMMEPFTGEMIESAVELSKFEDQFVAVPAQLKSKVWYYRQDLFEQSGINPDDVTDIDAFVAAGKQLHEALPDSYILNLRAEPSSWLAQDILSSFAPISFYDRAAGEFQIVDSPAFRALFETLDKLRDPDISAPIDNFAPDWAAGFVEGTIASSLINEWMTGFLPQYVPEQAGLWRTHVWPAVGDSNQGSDAGGAVWIIPEQAKNKEAAFDLLAATNLTGDGALQLLEIGGLTPYVESAREVVPTMEKPEANPENPNPLPWPPEFFDDSYFPVVFEAQEKLAWIDFDPAAAREIALMNDWTGRFVAGEASVDEALEGLQDDLESQVGDPWRV